MPSKIRYLDTILIYKVVSRYKKDINLQLELLLNFGMTIYLYLYYQKKYLFFNSVFGNQWFFILFSGEICLFKSRLL